MKAPQRLDWASLAIAALEYPGLDPADTEARLDFLAARARALHPRGSTPDQQVRALRKVLIDEEGFRGNSVNYTDPENSFLNVVLIRKLGIPISLSVLWLEVARRSSIPLYGIAFPGHFLVALETPGGRLVIDPYDGGRALTLDDCSGLLKKHAPNSTLSEEHFEPAAIRTIVWRMLLNLKHVYFKRGDHARAVKIEDLLLQLAPNHPGELRARAALLSALGAYKAALKDLERALEIGPAPDSAALLEAAKLLRHRLQFLN
ncbi:MAG TPA: transglutaminase-like domain-containing protein [Myxococcaceae bacterium]|nr:transglutaminase-like domain-containing protein [Myxococcaceae bacterium]